MSLVICNDADALHLAQMLIVYGFTFHYRHNVTNIFDIELSKLDFLNWLRDQFTDDERESINVIR